MTLGQKQTFIGVLRRQRVNKGSKSEHEAVVLDTGNGTPMKVQVATANPFSNPALEALVGQRVRIEGVAGSGVNALFVDSMADVVRLGPPGRPKIPYRPRF